MKKYTFVFIFIAFLLKSCIPPLSKFYIRNLTDENLILITRPSIETKLDLNGEKYDSVVAMRKNSSSDIGIYELTPNSKIYFYQSYGISAKVGKDISYEELKIIKSSDTILLDEKKIKDILIKKSKYIYEAEIK